MATIVKIKGSDGEVQYPITKPEAVIDENGKNILEIIQENSGGGGVSQDYVDTKVTELNELIEDFDSRLSARAEETTTLQENKADKSELTELSAEVGKKQDTLVSGTNIKTINGKSILGSGDIEIQGGGGSGGGITTPSGDPMHYMYEAVGAEWNGTGADKDIPGVYGDTITHKAGYWYLNELGDITTEEMRKIYIFANMTNAAKNTAKLMEGIETRTNIATWSGAWSEKIQDNQLFGYCYSLITALFRNSDLHYLTTNVSFVFTGCPKIEKIFPTLDAASTTNFNGSFDSCPALKEVRIQKLKINVKFDKSSNLSNASILFMIQNAAATGITITLHPTAYERAEADAEIQAAKASKGVSLAKV